MVIKNRFLGNLYLKIIGKEDKMFRIQHHFINEVYDEEMSELAFYNQSLIKFETSVDEFREEIIKARDGISKVNYRH